ncbi:Gfo/Idh/MocA family protein [Plantibacter sp. YIM 135347]|uniref:Gfo/Idh/MocA family protein n=1 Tax=Plantibacter sp. YIM 135347 TaxID=3423919 RepID=UPI003D33DAFC
MSETVTAPAEAAARSTKDWQGERVRVGVIGLGKMGLSHLAMIKAHPGVSVDAVVDSTGFILDVLSKYTGLRTFPSVEAMLEAVELDAVIVATPTKFHAPMVKAVIERGLHIFCEKPLSLSSADSDELAALAAERGVVTQVGYHNRFVGAFREVKRLLDLGAIGRVTHIQAEAYGPVVLKSRGSTWRSNRNEGGGCLYDYAAHPVDLLTWYAGEPIGVGGTVLGSVFSEHTEDEVFSTLFFDGNVSAQLSVNWSDESFRKMTTMITITGTAGRIHADRQECQVYLRDTAPEIDGYATGWNVKYTTELTEEVWYYLRGEEYSAQLDHFVHRVADGAVEGTNSFSSAAATDRVLELLTIDAAAGPSTRAATATAPVKPAAKKGFSWRKA